MRLSMLKCLLWILPVVLSASRLAAADRVTAGEFIVEPSTLISLGFEWQIDGDDNRNAEVSVSYRKTGESAWRQGLPLFRLQREQINAGVIAYTTPNMFAGSVFDLEPGIEYECQFVLSDPDGVDGRGENVVRVGLVSNRNRSPAAAPTTCILRASPVKNRCRPSAGCWRRLTRAPPAPTITIVSPPRVGPATRSWSTRASIRTIIPLRRRAWHLSDGTYFLTQSGTPDRPIVIKAAGNGDAIFDGDGVDTLLRRDRRQRQLLQGLHHSKHRSCHSRRDERTSSARAD